MTTNDSSAEDTRAHVADVPAATAKTPLQLALDGLVAAYTSAYPGGVLTPLRANKNQEIEDAIQVLLDLEAPILDEGFQEGRRDSKRPKLTRKPEDGEVILVEDSDEEIDELSDSEEKA
ncbi:hypothetical protein DFH06DRAFT_1348166 [Mycena polygramma]|nr:hypothetical protein DFH06DRAFT_1348166 [Mycena polygramma]